jgi:pSer/pThr/pTyr-binding forkhead associated (FHA) protein
MHTGRMLPFNAHTLFEVSSETGTAQIPARAATVKIGRAADNDIVLNNEQTVSRHHAELRATDDGWTICDLGSQNGTHVNGTRLADGIASPLGAYDVVGVGSVTIRLIESTLGEGLGDGDGLTVIDAGGREMHRLLTALSAREREVLTLVASGRTDEQVSNELFISVKTVHSHLDRIRDKTGLRRRAELTRLAVRLGLSSPS